MTTSPDTCVDSPQFLPKSGLEDLITALQQHGYDVIGPTIQQSAIVYDRLTSVDDLPQGWTEQQEAGMYRLVRRNDDRYFGYVVGPYSWKQFLFPPSLTLATATATDAEWKVEAADVSNCPQYAFLGMRACELAAISVQDRVFLQNDYADPYYKATRERALFIAVNCTQAAPTCFCVSMKTGPLCTTGFDLCMTELEEGFIISFGSDRGKEIMEKLPLRPPSKLELEASENEQNHAVQQQTRSMPKGDLRELLMNNLHHPQWDDVAERCLSCTNCTQVCPTCFCSSVHEVTDLDIQKVDRQRTWDSCFNMDFSYMNGGIVRNSVRSRYRQWLTHKLGTWHDQFDVSGCVGCGRCITWCPVGIDLTAEVAAIQGGA